MDALPYYKWLWIDYRANRKVQRMPWQARGLYRELLDEFWSEGSLPDDTERLAEVCGCTTEEFEQHWPVIRPCFTLQDGVLINAKMDSVRTPVNLMRVLEIRSGAVRHIPRRDRIKRQKPYRWAETRKRIFARDNFTCTYCNRIDSPLDCDHVVPVSKGGSDDDANLVTACRSCNRSRGSKSVEAWRGK